MQKERPPDSGGRSFTRDEMVDRYGDSAVPQFEQNFEPAGLATVQFGQATMAAVDFPQLGQNFDPAGIVA